ARQRRNRPARSGSGPRSVLRTGSTVLRTAGGGSVSATLAAVLLGGREWMPTAILVLTVAVLLLGFAYWRTTADTRTRWLAALLKAIGLGLLVLCLVEPLWSTTRAKPGANLFLVVADNSRSMEIDAGNGRSRGEWLRELLIADEAPWQVRLAQ